MNMSPHMATMSGADVAVALGIIVAGLIAIYVISRLNRQFGGKIKSALSFFTLGVLINIVAVIWTSFFGHQLTLSGATFDIHNLLMAIGMIMFVISTYRFSLLIPREG